MNTAITLRIPANIKTTIKKAKPIPKRRYFFLDNVKHIKIGIANNNPYEINASLLSTIKYFKFE